MTKDKVASISAKLKNIAKDEKRAFNVILLLYMQERVLYRLSISKYKEKFILKGGLLIFSLNEFKGRPTRDIDFLAEEISNDLENIRNTFREICEIACDDGIEYDINSIVVERIKEDAEYEGVRIKIKSLLGKMREVIQIDMGFGDIVIPKSLEITYPTLLENEEPKIIVYSKESSIAEKFQAMVSLSVFNTRMKDFYDIYNLAKDNNFELHNLKNAIEETFKNRETNISGYKDIFKEEFITDIKRNANWKAFLKRIGTKEELDYIEVMQVIKTFIVPVIEEADNKIWGNITLEWE